MVASQTKVNVLSSMPTKPDNYLVWSILVTLFCCLPFGVVAIVKSCAVDSAFNAGNSELAQMESAAAKKWCWISFITGFVVIALYAIFGFLLAAIGAGH